LISESIVVCIKATNWPMITIVIIILHTWSTYNSVKIDFRWLRTKYTPH